MAVCYNPQMSDKPTPLPSVEESLKAVAASVAEGQRYGAETRRILEQMARDSAVWKAEQEAVLADVNKGLAEVKSMLVETNKTLDRAAIDAAEAFRIVKEIGKQWGNYTNTAGEILEKEVFEALDAAKQIGDIRLVEVVPNLCVANRQYDMLGVNGKTSVLVEVKRSLSHDDVQNFIEKKMEEFPHDFPQHADNLKGALVYHTLRNDDAASEALKAGLILMRAEGNKRLRHITTPEDALKPQTTPNS